MNLFGYVGGDPVNWIDPWGLFVLTGDCPSNKDKIEAYFNKSCESLVENISDPCLKDCIRERCESGTVKCHAKEDQGEKTHMGWNDWYLWFIPSSTINVVADHPQTQNIFGEIAIHE